MCQKMTAVTNSLFEQDASAPTTSYATISKIPLRTAIMNVRLASSVNTLCSDACMRKMNMQSTPGVSKKETFRSINMGNM